ncbi:MAG: hypothetical protein IJY47_00085 [Clostridia bacterium]|nr:hypothetical protein [Clostridia bacterium]
MIFEQETLPQVQYTPPGDYDQATLLWRGTPEDFAALRKEVTPSMNEDDLRFCRDYFQSVKRVPYYGELRLLNRLVAKRREKADGTRVEALRCADEEIASTYRDLLAKLHVLFPQQKVSPSLSDIAQVSGTYLRMIGRGSPFFLPADGTPSRPSEEENPQEVRAAFVLLYPKENKDHYFDEIHALLTRDELRDVSPRRMPISEYGLLGTLARLPGGILANTELLPRKEDESLFSILGDAYVGYELWNVPRDFAPKLCRLATEYDLIAVYFARTTENGEFVIHHTGTSPYCLSLTFARALMNRRYSAHALVTKEDFTAGSMIPTTKICDSIKRLSASELPSMDLLTTLWERSAPSNCFSLGMNTCLDALLRLVSHGINRRAIGFSLTYSLPAHVSNEAELGQDLALLLGTYRVSLEFAAPESASLLQYETHEGNFRRLSCLAYASRPERLLTSAGGKPSDRVYFLALCPTPQGIPDFAELRRTCDRFTALWEEGKIHSAQSVSGSLSEALNILGKGFHIRKESVSAAPVSERGILFTSPVPLELPMVAILEAASNSEEEG